jgi:hypothetical protein
MARRAEPHVVVIDHPLGGLNEEELVGRIDAAFEGVIGHMDRLEEGP